MRGLGRFRGLSPISKGPSAVNTAVAFTDGSTYMTYPLPSIGGGPVTAMVWVRRDWSNPTYSGVLNLAVNNSFTAHFAQIYTDPPFTFTLDNGETHGNQGGIFVEPGLSEWAHVTETFQEQVPSVDYHHKLYAWDPTANAGAGGIIQTVLRNTTGPLNAGLNTVILGDQEAGAYPFRGAIACLRVFSSVLTIAQIAIERLSKVAVHASVIVDRRMNGVGDISGFTTVGTGISTTPGPPLIS